MTICPSCGENSEDQEICSNCGEPLAKEEIEDNFDLRAFRDDLIRYRSMMIAGVLVEYLAEVCIYLYKTNVIPSLVLFQLGTITFYAGFIMILVFTFKFTRLLGIGTILRVVTSILNCFLLINIGITIFLIVMGRRVTSSAGSQGIRG